MHGENLNVPVEKWFEFKVPHPNVPKDLISKSIEKYEERRNKEWNFPLNVKNFFGLQEMPFSVKTSFCGTICMKILKSQ